MKRQATTTQFFYQNGKLATVNQGGQKRAIFRSADMPLAELSAGERQETGLLEVDQNGSVLKVSGDADDEERHAYSAYGHDPSLPSKHTSAGFNGEHLEGLAAGYLLGNGYRLYSPTLMRFHSSDTISPFGKGGFNSYAYCKNDPINYNDPSGHNRLLRLFGNPSRPKLPKQMNSTIPVPDYETATSTQPFVRPDAPDLPSYSKTLKVFPSEQNLSRAIKLEPTVEKYNKYIEQQNRKLQIKENESRVNEAQKNRYPYGSDMWKYYQRLHRTSEAGIQHYTRKIHKFTTERLTLENHIKDLRGVN